MLEEDLFKNRSEAASKRRREINKTMAATKKYGMMIDVHYCTGCHTCEVACQQENGFSAEEFGIKVTEHILNERNRLMIDYVPYITDLCNFCLARYNAGQRPSCVKHCLSQCMTFGPVDEVMEAAKQGKKPMVFLK